MSKYIYDPNLVGKHSRFNKELCDKYDLPAREKIIKVLGEDFVKNNPDDKKQDLIIISNKEGFKYKYIELQVCTNWTSDKFPYPNVYIYERKKIYGNDTLFITLNRNMTKGFLFDGDSYDINLPQRLKKYSREYIYPIKWSKVMPIIIDTLTKEDLEVY